MKIKKCNKYLVAIFILIQLIINTSCNFIKNTLTYNEKTKVLVEYLISENYDSAVNCFALNRIDITESTINTLKTGLITYRNSIVDNFGTKINYTLIKSEKKWSTDKNKNTPKDCTIAQIQYSNGTIFGVFEVEFDDISGKIIKINTLDIKQPIPNMIIFWLIGIFALVIPVFNIFIIIQIKKQYRNNKNGFKYLSIFIFNVPSIAFSAVNGFSVHFLSFQILLGIGFNFMGYTGSIWTIGIPLAGIYWFIKLYIWNKKGTKTFENNVNVSNEETSNN